MLQLVNRRALGRGEPEALASPQAEGVHMRGFQTQENALGKAKPANRSWALPVHGLRPLVVLVTGQSYTEPIRRGSRRHYKGRGTQRHTRFTPSLLCTGKGQSQPFRLKKRKV